MFIYNLYKALNVALGSNDDQTVFFLQDSLLGMNLYLSFLSSFLLTFLIGRQYSFTWHQRRIAVNALV